MSRDFRGEVAAITGAASGMGRALALELARRGCELALSDVDAAGLEETTRLVAAEAPQLRCTSTQVDVADRAVVEAWAAQVMVDHGRVNLLFNNAGVALGAPLANVRPEDFHWVFGINFWGVVHGTQAFLPHLQASARESGVRGHVINTSSLFGLLAMPANGAYNATKFAVRGYTEALRMELDLTGTPVSATCVHPGGVRTAIARSARMDASTEALVGMPVEQARAHFDRLLATTSAERAAREILRGVQRNARRVLVGPDAKLLDLLVRLLGSAYQPVLVWFARRSVRAQRPQASTQPPPSRSAR
ncbi:SDR family NAD(P)-dependent oxidoreductase [Rivibacter subsaxonicus]|uniref:NADP-dependent 3-hydroxy acid dehydrogenase YdfG n=1 Tax=Rivibacter subsaxonicus TaxID=457575 RepID=A0A4Q7VP37_9BURK|nr:SDR family NAD(P)-dependent oxidoreductase [Rivibacter subsaxonicus]RZT98004.1 NADP-dependent 3-hydroxy acid dehydrogenase YdfG [Rivibacter subsaxonicus]